MATLADLKAKINDLVRLQFPQVEDWTKDLNKMMIPVGLEVQIAIELNHCTLRHVPLEVDRVSNHTTAADRYHRWQRQINNAYRQILPLPNDQPLDKLNRQWVLDHAKELITSLSKDAKQLYENQDVQYFSRLGALIQIYACQADLHAQDQQVREIQRLYRRGITSRSIAEQTGYTPKEVAAALSTLADGERLRRRNARILKMYIESGSVRKAAKRYHLGITTVSNIIKTEANLPSLADVRNKYNVVVEDGRRHFSKRDVNAILERVERYLEQHGPQTLQRIAEHFNITYGSLRRWVSQDPRLTYQQDKYPHVLMLKQEDISHD